MHRSWFTPMTRLAAPIALVALAACGSDSTTGTTGGTGLTTAQRSALTTTLSRPDVAAAIAGSGGAFVGLGLSEGGITGLSSVGSINFGTSAGANRLVPRVSLVGTPRAALIQGPTGTYQAFGTQLVVALTTTAGVTNVVWTGFLAFDNLTNPTTIITAGVFENDATSAASVASTVFGNTDSDTRLAEGTLIKITGASTSTVYSATSGSIAITSASFSGNTSCPSATLTTVLTACSYAGGTVAGSFGFTAKTEFGAGPDSVIVPVTTISVPSSQATVAINETAAQNQ